jgi:hypothetical protein
MLLFIQKEKRITSSHLCLKGLEKNQKLKIKSILRILLTLFLQRQSLTMACQLFERIIQPFLLLISSDFSRRSLRESVGLEC